MSDGGSSSGDTDVTQQSISLEERGLTVLLALGMPFLIGFLTWGVIILAFAQWKIR